MSWSTLNWRYKDTPVSFYITYTNEYDDIVTLKSITLKAGTGQGTFGDSDGSATHIGPRVVGDGQPITLNIHGSIQTVTNVVGTKSQEYGNIPEYNQTADYTVNFFAQVMPKATATFSVVAAGGSCLVIDAIEGETSRREDQPDISIVYDANGGVFSDGEVQRSIECKSGDVTTTLHDEDAPEGPIHTVKFDPNGGVSAGAVVNVSMILDSWNDMEDGSGTSYPVNYDFVAEEEMLLYAIWRNATLPAEFPQTTRENYILTDWNSEPDGTGYTVDHSTVVYSDLTCYAMWVGSPVWVMTSSGWRPWYIESEHNVDNINKVKSAHRENLREIEWVIDKPVYMFTSSGWVEMHRGSKYATLTAPMNEPVEFICPEEDEPSEPSDETESDETDSNPDDTNSIQLDEV